VYTLYDLNFVANAEWTTEDNRAACWHGASRASTKADWIVAISQASRIHYLSVFPHFPADRIKVIHPCSRFTAFSFEGSRPPALANVPEGLFWLSVGTIEPRKNQRRIAEAFANYLKDGGAQMPLVFAGGSGWLMEDFRDHLEKLGISPHVILTGYVSDDELIWLYRNCHANIYVSLFEGFGLPVLEGMQFGAPTIASNTSSIPEVTGNAAIMVDPADTEGLVRAMLRVSGSPDERAKLSCEARSRASLFDWQKSAGQLLALYEEAVSAPRRTANR
jgi:glycosyltransferase involved in cell wall biosynthesis